jgi:hypothetical protein
MSRAFWRTVGMESRLVVSLVILSTVFASTEWAQFTTARPTGSVLDPSGSADVGASVEVRQVNMGYRQSKQTAVSDEYVFPSLLSL